MVSENKLFSKELAQQLVESTDEFPVDFDNAWQWLELSTKGNAKKAFLKCDFLDGLDYKVSIHLDKNLQGGRPDEVIQLTVDCFKQWAMMCKTEKGKIVRRYFLECERVAKEVSKSKSKLELIAEALLQIDKVEKEQEVMKHQLALEAQRVDEIEKIVNQHDCELDRIFKPDGEYYTVRGYASKIDCKNLNLAAAKSIGKSASNYCRQHNIPTDTMSDPRYGKVNCYPERVLAMFF